MSIEKEKLLQKLSDAVLEMDDAGAAALSKQVIDNGIDAFEAIDKGLTDGMTRAGQLFKEEEYFIPELLMCSDAMTAGLDVLSPHIKVDQTKKKHKVVIGVMEGDTHDIGKNLVRIMLEASGFDVLDIGRDVPPIQFVDKAKEIGAEIICLSTLMTTTMNAMARTIELLKEQGIRNQFKVLIGGGPISQSFADKIGANGYSPNANEAVILAKRLVG